MAKRAVNTFAPDCDIIRSFLDNVLNRDWFHLLSSDPRSDSNRMGGYVAEHTDDALEWVLKEQDRGRNTYFALNAPSNKQSKKAKKEELKFLYGVHVDMDLPDAMPRDSDEAEDAIDDMVKRAYDSKGLLGGHPHIIFTGNGVQALWMFPRPLKATDNNKIEVETLNKRLMAEFDAPRGTHNCERILRVPGTVNFPSKKKTERGCKEILAELVHTSRDDFTFEDFDGLPAAPKAALRASADRVDYTKFSYQDWNDPYTWEEFLKAQPEVRATIIETLASDGLYDRSKAAWHFLLQVVRYIALKENVHAKIFMDDRDIKKNIAHIFWDSDLEDMQQHYIDHQYGPAMLGYDIQRAIAACADDDKGPTARAHQKLKRAEARSETEAKPIYDVEPHEARKAFIGYLEAAVQRSDLTNAVCIEDKASARQLATESNVRDILREARISARWNVMTDEARFYVDPEAGGKGREAGRPAMHWERALEASYGDMRTQAEMNLLCDAFAQYGIVARKELPPLLENIAKENRYHPIEDYCKAREWDGVDRFGDVADCLTSSHPLKKHYIRLFFRQCVAAVKSLRNYAKNGDGLQISGIVVLDGPTFIGKTTFWHALTPKGFRSKGMALRLGQNREEDSKRECLSGLVCVLDEIGASQSRSEADAWKNFISASFDEFRVSFGRVPISKPRMTVFAGTANDFTIHDQTGSRRFYVMHVTAVDLDAVSRIDLQQCYAQAWHEVMVGGKQWWLTREEDSIRALHNDVHRLISEEESALTAYMDRITDRHDFEWLSAAQICEVLGVRYVPARWPAMRQLMLRERLEYRDKVCRKNKQPLRCVWGFPVLPDKRILVTQK